MNSSTEASASEAPERLTCNDSGAPWRSRSTSSSRARPTTQRSSSWTMPERSADWMKEAAGSSSPSSLVIRSLASGVIERYELLLRMTSEEGELLPAASFIPSAERSGMVQELDRWVVGRALELLVERERQGAPLSLHVNLSGASLADASVLEFIERRLD